MADFGEELFCFYDSAAEVVGGAEGAGTGGGDRGGEEQREQGQEGRSKNSD